jgi:peroxiredoxin
VGEGTCRNPSEVGREEAGQIRILTEEGDVRHRAESGSGQRAAHPGPKEGEVNGAGAPGAPAPDFDLPIVGGGYRGLRDIVEPGGGILVFFKESCEASKLLLPHLNSLARALEREERLFLAVAQEDEAATRAFRDAHGLAFAVASDLAPYDASVEYGVTNVPTLFVIDGAGVIAERIVGFVKAEYLALGPAIEQALALGDAPPILDSPETMPDLKPG